MNEQEPHAEPSVGIENHDHEHDHGRSMETAWMAAGGALLAAVMALRLADGSASALVQSWYLPVITGTCVLLFAFALHAGWRAYRAGLDWRPHWSARSTLAIGVIGAPIVIAALYQPSPLGSANLDAAANSSGSRFSESARSNAGERNVYQWAYQFETAPISELQGQEFSAVGFVYHRPESPAAQFELARFVVACCVADAIGFTLPIQWPAAQEFAADSWVRVEGQVAAGADGRPVVVARAVEQIDPPSNPYIYP
jgi:putative membrane protein